MTLIHAEISVYPIGTGTTSSSFYIAKGIEAIKNIKDIRYEIHSMGTILESNDVDKIYESAKKIMEVVHNLGVNRVEIILKIDRIAKEMEKNQRQSAKVTKSRLKETKNKSKKL